MGTTREKAITALSNHEFTCKVGEGADVLSYGQIALCAIGVVLLDCALAYGARRAGHLQRSVRELLDQNSRTARQMENRSETYMARSDSGVLAIILPIAFRDRADDLGSTRHKWCPDARAFKADDAWQSKQALPAPEAPTNDAGSDSACGPNRPLNKSD